MDLIIGNDSSKAISIARTHKIVKVIYSLNKYS